MSSVAWRVSTTGGCPRREREARRSPERIIGIMKWTRLAPALLTLLVLSPAPGFAGSLPNFSGTWQIDKSRTVVQSERPFASLATQADLTLVIDHRDPELRIEQHAKLKIAEGTLVSTYYTDGREASNRNARGELMTSRSHWEQGALVTDLRIARPHGKETQVAERRDVLSLSEDGTKLFMDTTRKDAGQGKPDSARLVFFKK